MSNHTPTPYRVNRGATWTIETTWNTVHGHPNQIARIIMQDSLEGTEANAEFICRAANSHEELLAACKALVWLANDHDWEETHLPELEAARAAIRKAEAT